jgi:tRNA pseudouridine13 synthase
MPSQPRIRVEPEDFEVEEIARDPASGMGAYAQVWVEKRLLNTDEVARLLARAYAVPVDQVSWAGRKDRRAVARQAFSLPWRDGIEPIEMGDGLRVLRVERHDRRLGPGKTAGNRFRLLVRDVDPELAALAADRWQGLAARGLPNRYGRQRFGWQGANVERGRAILLGEAPRGERRQATLMISALQSAIFNEVLARRPGLNEIWPGDVGYVHATGETLWLAGTEADVERARRFEMSATGPIVGTKMKKPRGRVAALEAEVLRELGLPAFEKLTPPAGIQLFGDRRSLRVPIAETAFQHDPGAATLELRFALPPGGYATVVLEELFPAGFEEGPAEESADEDDA